MKLFKRKNLQEIDFKQRQTLEDMKTNWLNLTMSGKDPSSSYLETKEDIDWIYDTVDLPGPDIIVSQSFHEYQNIPSLTGSHRLYVLSEPVNSTIDGKFRRKVLKELLKTIESKVTKESIQESSRAEQVLLNKTRVEVLDPLTDSTEPCHLQNFSNTMPFGLSVEFWLMTCCFFEEIGYLGNNATLEDVFRYKSMMTRGIWHASFFKDVAVLCSTPKKIKKDSSGRLHSVTEPAVQWRGDVDDYFIRGVRFDEKLWRQVTRRELKIKDILEISNIEQRYVTIQLYGHDTLIDEMDSQLLDKSKRGNQLYVLKNNLIPGRSLLKYQCPSTNRIYFSFVPDEMTNADEAMAWKFHLTQEEYRNLEVES